MKSLTRLSKDLRLKELGIILAILTAFTVGVSYGLAILGLPYDLWATWLIAGGGLYFYMRRYGLPFTKNSGKKDYHD